ncbi:hypothetical protein [Jeotgalicoccus halotolerans]|uniref:Uncharacterized protein n=1 Tax=Jeotgalicoccus halotolerans TaxID=157227 RepID=A0A3E0AVL0_9STAP|nr:hypothetical protein [Jeotgalicoccus halotolerans]REG23795.1 hypothetical protein DFR63_1542 [Jeotgalicoccus halotolerans]
MKELPKIDEFKNKIVDERKAKAFEYAGEFSPFEVAEVFFLPVRTIRQMEQQKNLFYRGR